MVLLDDILRGSLLIRRFCLKYRSEHVWPQYLALLVQKLFPALASERVEAIVIRYDNAACFVSLSLSGSIMVTQMTLISPNKSYYYSFSHPVGFS
jgi:hypothetical protein